METLARIIIENGGAGTPNVSSTGYTNPVNSSGSAIKTGAIAGATLAAIQGLVGLTKQLVSIMRSVSPHLEATFKILKRSFEFALRPIADTISYVLRPFAIKLLQSSIEFYKKFLEQQKQEETGTQPSETEAGTDISWVGTFKDLLDALKPTWDGFLAVLVTLGAVLKTVVIGVTSLIDVFSQIFMGVLSSITNLLRGDFVGALEDTRRMFEAVGDIAQEFRTKVLAVISSVFGVDSIILITKFTNAWDSLLSSVSSFFDYINSWIDRIRSRFGGSSGGGGSSSVSISSGGEITDKSGNTLMSSSGSSTGTISYGGISGGTVSVNDALITKSGKIVKFNPEDNIFATKSGSGMNGSSTINISINAIDSGSITQQVIDKITQAVSNQMRRGLTSRFSESVGV